MIWKIIVFIIALAIIAERIGKRQLDIGEKKID